MMDSKEEIMNHLMFHKSLIDEGENGERINRYIQMVNDIGDIDLAFHDPVDRAIATAFRLVMDNRFNPWDIDLLEFAKLYLKRIKKDDHIDFVTAGKIVLMAWSVLKLKSERVLVDVKPVEQVVSYFSDWDIMGNLYEDPQDVDYTSVVLDSPEPIIEEAIRHKEERPFTLMEFLDGFSEIQEEVEARYELMRLREEQSEDNGRFEAKVHKEDLNHDIMLTWMRICGSESDKVLLKDLILPNDKHDLITIFTSILFLAKEGKVALGQRNFPFGDIYIRNLVPTAERVIEMPVIETTREEGTEVIVDVPAEQKLVLEELAVV